MKTAIKIPTTKYLAFSLFFVFLTSACHKKELDGMVPDEWYVLPEDGPHEIKNSGDESRAAKAIDSIFSMQSETLAKMDAVPGPASTTAPANAPHNWVPWHLDAFLTDISVTLSGALGVLMLEGSRSVEVLWKRAGAVAQQPEAPLDRASSTFAVSANNKVPIAMQLEPAIRGAIASGRVTDEGRLRNSLSLATRDFENVVDTLSKTDLNSAWNVVGYRVIVSLDASGAVTPVTTVGAAVFVRFDWFRDRRAPTHLSPPSYSGSVSTRELILSKNLLNFCRSFSEDLNELSLEGAIAAAGFKVAEVRLGLGIGVSGDVGVIAASGSIVGIVQFAPANQPPAPSGSISGPDPELPQTIPFMTSKVNQIDLAEKMKTLSAPTLLRNSNVATSLIRIDRSKLRKGIRKAARMGAFFARRAQKQKAKNRKWAIAEIATAFEMSVSGTIGLVTVSGTPSLEIVHVPLASGGNP